MWRALHKGKNCSVWIAFWEEVWTFSPRWQPPPSHVLAKDRAFAFFLETLDITCRLWSARALDDGKVAEQELHGQTLAHPETDIKSIYLRGLAATISSFKSHIDWLQRILQKHRETHTDIHNPWVYLFLKIDRQFLLCGSSPSSLGRLHHLQPEPAAPRPKELNLTLGGIFSWTPFHCKTRTLYKMNGFPQIWYVPKKTL